MKKWTEEEILFLDSESDRLEWKSGAMIDDGLFKEKLAKQLSAFANSAGGSIVIGLSDDGVVDGVRERVGKTGIEEWIAQIASDLIEPSILGFRVTRAVRARNSKIPAGKVLVVLEVPQSTLAPHQVRKSGCYYYRVDRESKPAPHYYVELLFGRKKFPGPNVATAWLQTVINPFIYSLAFELDQIDNEKWGFDRHRSGWLGCAIPLLREPIQGNQEQFFEEKKVIFDLVTEHDQTVRDFIREVFSCYAELTRSALLNGLYEGSTSMEMLKGLQDENRCPEFHRFSDCTDRATFISKLFSKDDAENNTRTLTELMINRTPKGQHDSSYRALWSLHHEKFIGELESTYKNYPERIRSVAAELKSVIVETCDALKEERKGLCYKYGLSYAEHVQTVITTPSSPRWIG